MPGPSPRDAATMLAVLARSGILRPPRPDHAVGMAAALAYWGVSPAGGYAAHAVRHPRRVALVDPDGSLTFGELDRLTTAAAVGLRSAGAGAGDRVGVLCGNHRGFVVAVVALAKLGATSVLLNTGSAPRQVSEVVAAEGLPAVVADDPDRVDAPLVVSTSDLLAYGVTYAGAKPVRPERNGGFVILTSGTTGTPKGAHRDAPTTLEPLISLLSVIPLRAGETTVVAAPLFHAWGFAQWMIAVVLGSTVVLTGTFDAPRTLAAVSEHRATALVAVPVMLRRLLDVPEAYDTASLRVVALSGSALPPDVARRFLEAYGDVLYDLYGSTEVAWATIATPADLRAAPGTVGRPPFGTRVSLVDPVDGVGRIFVGNALLVSGYTTGGGREVRDGLMATGDLGRFDSDGRLYVVGREDDMVVSGGENVFPAPVEDCLSALPSVADVAVVGVPDDEFGQRLAAYVVRAPGAAVTEDDVRSAVREALARHYVPRDVTFVDALPRNAAGKVVKRDLA